jgi:hypothetical protein
MSEVDKTINLTKEAFAVRIAKVQSELKAPKNQRNTFGNYSYRNCEDILEAVKPLLKKHLLLLIISDVPEEIGSRIYIKAEVTIWDALDSKNYFKTWAYARETQDKKGMDEAQITGAASSYARKYALNAMFLIDDTKDADTDEQHNEVQNRPYVAPDKKEVPGPSDNQKNKIRELGEKAGLDPEMVEARIDQLETPGDALKAIAKLTESVKG